MIPYLIFIPHFAILILLIGHIFLKKKGYQNLVDLDHLPLISVLVAARNEELNIKNCLSTLVHQRIDFSKYEVLIGNDGSTDKTASISKEIADRFPNFKVIEIEESKHPNLKGKANVIHQLIHNSKGEIILLCDADCSPNENWIVTMANEVYYSKGMVTGSSIVREETSYGALSQSTEWIYFHVILNFFEKIGGITCVGNNLGFYKKDYIQVGGYENIPFSVTEDYALFSAFKKIGIKQRHLLVPESIAITQPAVPLQTYLEQRRRWFKGGKKLPVSFWIPLISYLSFWPFILGLSFFGLWKSILIVLCIKFIFDLSLIMKTSALLRILFYKISFMAQFFGSPIYNFMVVVYCFLPGKVLWKGRKY